VIALRPYDTELATAMYQAARESLETVGPWMPWLHDGYSLEQAFVWAERQQRGFEERTEFEFAIIGDDDRFLGGIGLNNIDQLNPRANLGYWVRAGEMGKGVATAATRLLVEWTFANTPLVRIEVVVSIENKASLRVAEKAGAVREGILRSRLLLHGRMHDAAMFAFVRPREDP
jgi:RimJ/RimL family protein N-acetyltransferase